MGFGVTELLLKTPCSFEHAKTYWIKGEDEDIALTHGLVESDEIQMATGTLVGRTLVTADNTDT